MRIILTLILILSLSLVGYLQFSDVRQINDPTLANAVYSHLQESHRQNLAESFNQSLENESFGRILNRAADLIATSITVVNLENSQLPGSQNRNRSVIIKARYFVEKTSEPPQQQLSYLKFTRTAPGQWIYRHDSTQTDYYLNFLGFE